MKNSQNKSSKYQVIHSNPKVGVCNISFSLFKNPQTSSAPNLPKMVSKKTEYLDFGDNEDIDSIGCSDVKSSFLIASAQSSSYIPSPLSEQRKLVNRPQSLSPSCIPRSTRKHIEDPAGDNKLQISALKKKLVTPPRLLNPINNSKTLKISHSESLLDIPSPPDSPNSSTASAPNITRYRPSSYHAITKVPTPRNHLKINDLLSAKTSDVIIDNDNLNLESDIENDNNNNNEITYEILTKKSDEDNKKPKPHIKWNNITIREYKSNIAPTSVPLRGGVPIGLGWDVLKEENYEIEDYENLKMNNPDHLDNKRYEKEGSLSAIERQWILQRIGVSKVEINMILQDLETTRNQRVESKMDPVVDDEFDSTSYIPWTFIPTPRNSVIKK